MITVTTNQRDDFLSTKPGVGFDREVLEGFVSLHKLRLVLVQIPSWDGLIPALKEGRGDVIAGRFTVTEARRKEIDFTQEVFPTRNVAMSRSPHPVVATLEHAIAERHEDPAIQLGVFVGPPTSLAYGVRKQDTGLLAALDEYVGNLRRTPTWSRLVVKYFGAEAPEILRKARSE